MAENIKIAVIVNSFNRKSLLKIALDAIQSWYPSSTYENFLSVVIYDAGSTDGTLEWIKDSSSIYNFNIHLIQPEVGDDTSFSAGLNTGVSYAIKYFTKLEYLLFYETDNQLLSEKALEGAEIELANNSTLGACGFTVRYANGRLAGTGMPFPKVSNFLLGRNLVYKLKLEEIPYKWIKGNSGFDFSYVDVVFTSPLLVKVKAWQASGGLDQINFPFSDCDIDWAKRLKDAGWKMGVIKSNDAIHDNLSAISTWSKNRAIQFHRARLKYLRKNNPVSIYFIWPIPLMIKHFLELLLIKIIIRDNKRKEELSCQFRSLLTSVFKAYNK